MPPLGKCFTRLLLNNASLARILTENELNRLAGIVQKGQVPQRIMVAGGTSKGGSERILLQVLGKSVDVVVVNIKQAACPHVVADLTNPWPFTDATFDAVFSTWVLEHLREPSFFFCEAYRVLSADGFIVVTVPFIQRKHGSPFDYWRFTDTTLMHMARAAGFVYVEVWSVGGTPFLCATSLLWPLFRVPILSALLVVSATLADYALLAITHFLKRGVELVSSYPIAYVLYAHKGLR